MLVRDEALYMTILRLVLFYLVDYTFSLTATRFEYKA